MCGLIAIFPKKNYLVDSKALKELSNQIHHRGPDGEGFEVDNWFAVAHKRLSIIDINSSQQPFYSSNGKYILVYNGEIYNYIELREKLKKLGHSFRTEGDTEVILNAYEEWKEDCVNYFEGMFAFVIINRSNNTGFCARDHLGIKPLFICNTKKGLILSSEIKPLLGILPLNLNEDFLFEQFACRYVSGKNTIYNEVQRLPAGCTAIIKQGGDIKVSKYYDITKPLNNIAKKINYKELEKLLEESIFRHTRSDVGYNIQLSGGLDSSYIASKIKLNSESLRTYSVSLKNQFNEKEYQQFVVNKLNTQHYDYLFDEKDYSNSLEEATWAMDMPIIHGACVFLMLLTKESSATSKVIITGEGADELFSGYSRYKFNRLTKITKYLNQINFPSYLIPPIGKLNTLKNYLDSNILINNTIDGDLNILKNSLITKNYNLEQYSSATRNFKDLLKQIIVLDQTSYLESLFERQDRMSMHSSVESRVPFCTPSLFDLVNSWNPNKKFPGGEPKGILKNISSKLFPTEFIYRKKNGFKLPYNDWLKNKNSLGAFLMLLTDQTFKERGFFEYNYIQVLINEHLKDYADHSKVLLRLIFFEVWYRQFIGSNRKIDLSSELFIEKEQ